MRRQSPNKKAKYIRLVAKRERRRLRRLRSRQARQAEAAAQISANLHVIAAHDLHPPSQRERVPIILPEVLSLRRNFAETVTAVDTLRKSVLIDGRPATLYFDEVRSIGPGATLMLTGEIYRCRYLRAWRQGFMVNGNYPSAPDVFFQLREMGFYGLIGVDDMAEILPDDRDRTGRPYFIPFRTNRGVDGEFASKFCDMVVAGAFDMGKRAKRRMVGALKEAMANTDEHAYLDPTGLPVMKRRWWLSGYVEPQAHEMMIMLLDQGIGIPASLGITRFQRIAAVLGLAATPTDGNIIAAATELHRSSTGAPGRGKGFRDMKSFIDECDDGELRVLSDRGTFRYMKDGQMVSDEASSIGGTLIEWRVRHGETVEVSADDDEA